MNFIWSAFLRGQLLLAIVIFVVTSLVMTILGLRNALVVGLIAGALEFIPLVGPVIAGAVGVAVALFQPANPFGLSTVGYAVLVLIAFIAIQQTESNFLVPRIIGHSLNLHPLAVLIVAVMGATLAGVLGLLLAAPVLATSGPVGPLCVPQVLRPRPLAPAYVCRSRTSARPGGGGCTTGFGPNSAPRRPKTCSGPSIHTVSIGRR